MDVDSICKQMSEIAIEQEVNKKLLSDLNIIISEILNIGNYNIDIYELCVNCGHSLTWDQEYTIYETDIAWLKTSGKVYFYETLNNYIKIDTVEIYNLVTRLYENILELFTLQLE